jgi:hypothetical protein
MDSNADVAQSKLLIDLFLGELFEERKINPRIFQGDPENKFWGLFFGAMLEMLLEGDLHFVNL